jgi:hypothetical protein
MVYLHLVSFDQKEGEEENKDSFLETVRRESTKHDVSESVRMTRNELLEVSVSRTTMASKN